MELLMTFLYLVEDHRKRKKSLAQQADHFTQCTLILVICIHSSVLVLCELHQEPITYRIFHSVQAIMRNHGECDFLQEINYDRPSPNSYGAQTQLGAPSLFNWERNFSPGAFHKTASQRLDLTLSPAQLLACLKQSGLKLGIHWYLLTRAWLKGGYFETPPVFLNICHINVAIITTFRTFQDMNIPCVKIQVSYMP